MVALIGLNLFKAWI